MKLHLGAGNKILSGFINCDCRKLPGIDKVFDLEEVPYPFEDNSIEYILTTETLEHLSWINQEKIFKEFKRILKNKGRISMQVPDIGLMCKNYVNNEICSCVPHKEKDNGFKADPDCKKCKGKATINDKRWLMAFCGAQKHPWDFHKTMFTKEYLEDLIGKFDLKLVKYEDVTYKIKAIIEKNGK